MRADDISLVETRSLVFRQRGSLNGATLDVVWPVFLDVEQSEENLSFVSRRGGSFGGATLE